MKILSLAIHLSVFLGSIGYICRAQTFLALSTGEKTQYQEGFFTVVVEPVQCTYLLDDIVAFTVSNQYRDTIYVTPSLQGYRGLKEGWYTIVDDLQSYWDEANMYESSILKPIPPGGLWRFSISVNDISRSFPDELGMRFGIKTFKFGREGDRLTGGLDYGPSWMGTPFLLPAWNEHNDSVFALTPQKGRKRDTIFTVYDPVNNTPVIPVDVFDRHPYRLILADPFDTMEIKVEHKTRYVISWPSPSIEGSLDLVISKRQMWLQSSHDNPNPNEIFWVTDIDEVQYTVVQYMLDKHQKDFEDFTSEFGFVRSLGWKKYQPESLGMGEASSERDFKAKRYQNAKKLIDMINSGLSAGKQMRFPNQEELDRILPVRWE